MRSLPYRDINKKVRAHHSDERKIRLVSDTRKPHISVTHQVLMILLLLLTAPDAF